MKPAQICRYVSGMDRLLSVDDIFDVAFNAAPVCGVYFLTSETELLYIGQSRDVHSRVTTHRREGKIPFVRVATHRCELDDLNMLETVYIALYKPQYNVKKGLLLSSSKPDVVVSTVDAIVCAQRGILSEKETVDLQ